MREPTSDSDWVLAYQTIDQLRAELAESQKDTERLDWLEAVGFATSIGEHTPVHCWRLDDHTLRWTAQRISSEFRTARAAIDAAVKECK